MEKVTIEMNKTKENVKVKLAQMMGKLD